MAKFRLKAGTYQDDSGTYNHKDPKRNVVSSQDNLAALHPDKFERIDTQLDDRFEDNPPPRRDPYQGVPGAAKRSPGGMPPLTPTTAKAIDTTKTDLAERYGVGKLEDLELAELKEIAAAEDVDLKGATDKAAVVEALKASQPGGGVPAKRGPGRPPK